MNINIKTRENILALMMLTVFVSFTLSFALTNIIIFLFIAFFFFDTRANLKLKFNGILKDKLALMYMLFFLIQVVGIIYSQDKPSAIRRVEVMLPILFLPAIISVEQLCQKLLMQILVALKILIPLSFLGLLFYHIFVLNRTINTFVNFTITEVVEVSQFYLAFILLIPIIECLRQIVLGNKILFHLLLLLFNLGFVFLLGNKTTLILLLILGVFISISVFKKNKKRGWTLLFTLLVSILIAAQLPIVKGRANVFLKTTDFNFEVIKTKNKFTITKNTVEHRILIDYVAVKAIINGLPFGYGTGDYLQELYKGYKALKFKAGIYYKYNAHNQYFSEFLKTGIFGGLIFLGLIVLLLKRVDITDYYTYIILFFAMACCVESYLFRQHGVAIFAFIIPFIVYNTKKLTKT